MCTVDVNNPYLHLIGDTSVYQHGEADEKYIDICYRYVLTIGMCKFWVVMQIICYVGVFFMVLYITCIYFIEKIHGKSINITATTWKPMFRSIASTCDLMM